MGLVSAFRRAEEQARKAARATMERTIVGLDDAERAIRRRMRIYPKQVPRIPIRTAGATAAPFASLETQSAEQQLEKAPKAS